MNDSDVTNLKGIGNARAAQLKGLFGLDTITKFVAYTGDFYPTAALMGPGYEQNRTAYRALQAALRACIVLR